MKIISAAIAASLLVPAVASADEVIITTPPAQPSRTVVIADPYNTAMLASGLTVFALSYGTSVAFALDADRGDPNRRLFVPVVGPWLALADRPDCNVRDARCDNETAAKVFLALDGIIQAGGVLTVIGSLASPGSHREVVYADNTKVRVSPTVVGQYASPGIGVSGRF